MPTNAVASCVACGGTLERTAGRSVTAAFAVSLSVLLLLAAANLLPFLSVRLAGIDREARLGSIVPILMDSQWVLMALTIGAFAVALPLLRFALLTATLGAVWLERRPAWLGRAFRWAVVLDLWSMPDVLLIGSFIGYTRVAARLPTEIGAGGWCFLAAAGLSMIAHASLDRRTVWRAIRPDGPVLSGDPVISCTTCDLTLPASSEGTPCPRCGASLHTRKPDAMIRTTALILAGFALYPAANIWPMTVVTRLGDSEGHIILYGVKRLIDAGLWPFAGIIFTTSIAIPLLKLVAIAWFLLSVRFRWRWALVGRTRLHRSIDSLGRWSNIDIMILIVFVPLLQYGQLATADIGIGAACFLAVVVLTMFASRSFDARLMWDAAEPRR